MVKVRYTYKNKIVDKQVYEKSLILCDMKRSGCLKPFEEPTCRFNNPFPNSTSISIVNEQPSIVNEHAPTINNQPLIGNEHVPIVKEQSLIVNEHAPIVNEQPPIFNEQSLIVNEHAPIVNEQPPIVNEDAPIVNEVVPNNNNNENGVAVMAGRARGRVPPMAVIQNIIGECSPPFVKQLTKTDVTDSQGRLAFHKEFVTHNLVPMFNDDENLKNGISVIVYDSEGREYDMTFILWTSKLYVLTKSWKEFYKTNDLTQPGEFISVWMFRHVIKHKLCFAIMREEA